MGLGCFGFNLGTLQASGNVASQLQRCQGVRVKVRLGFRVQGLGVGLRFRSPGTI